MMQKYGCETIYKSYAISHILQENRCMIDFFVFAEGLWMFKTDIMNQIAFWRKKYVFIEMCIPFDICVQDFDVSMAGYSVLNIYE